MKSLKKLASFAAVAFVALLAFLLVTYGPGDLLWKAAFLNRIDFWGKVVDAEGKPISGALISITLRDDSSWSFSGGNNSEFVLRSDSSGSFKILRKRVAGILVKASVEGYAPVIDIVSRRDLSVATISYIGPDRNMENRRPTSDQPTILHLRKKKPLAKLEHSQLPDESLSKTGQPVLVSLGGKLADAKIEIRCWSSVPEPFTYARYDWRAEIRVKDGELQPIVEPDPVEAPEAGYRKEHEIHMPAGIGNWGRTSPSHSRNFWIKFQDGSYGKVEIDITTDRSHNVDLERWRNTDGDRNFER